MWLINKNKPIIFYSPQCTVRFKFVLQVFSYIFLKDIGGYFLSSPAQISMATIAPGCALSNSKQSSTNFNPSSRGLNIGNPAISLIFI